MIFPHGLHFDIARPYSSGPCATILQTLVAEQFDPRHCRTALEALRATISIQEGLIDLGALENGGFLLTEKARFPALGEWRLWTETLRIDLADDEVPAIGDLLRMGFQTNDVAAFRSYADCLGDRALELLTAGSSRPLAAWPDAVAPGIYRREHASLLIRSHETVILVDPIVNVALPYLGEAPVNLGVSHIDAVFITHGHGDHFHPPSILGRVTADTPVFVPAVPRVSLLTPFDFTETLLAVGQRVETARWHTTIRVGDIDIDVLPFYGEQPTREPPGATPTMRNWGNCYRFNMPQFSAVLLVDSGVDPLGDMVEVIRRSVEERGPIDVVLSCLRSFPAPFFGGLSTDWTALSFSALRQLFSRYQSKQLLSSTGGVDGAARACVAGQAKYYLPYANGFEGAGRAISDIGWGANEGSEDQKVTELRGAIDKMGGSTVAHCWTPGASAEFRDGRIIVKGERL